MDGVRGKARGLEAPESELFFEVFKQKRDFSHLVA
jgi:hypothetical protein